MTGTDSPSAGMPAAGERPEETSWLALLWRVLVFVAIVGAAYWAFRQLTVVLFAPEIVVVRPVLPPRDISPASTVELGVMVVNAKPMAGAAFVVATMSDGRLVEGPTVEVPQDDTTFVPVNVTLQREDQVLSLVVFDGWRGVRRLQTFSGLRVGVTESGIAVDYVDIPDTLPSSEAFTLTLRATNHGTESLTIRPRISFESGPFRQPRWVVGEAVELQAGATAPLRVTVEEGFLPPGTHFAQAVVETEEGVQRGGARYPVPLVISG